MGPEKLPVGSSLRIARRELQSIITALQDRGYRTVGPRLRDEAIVYDDLDSVDQLPIGLVDEQRGGSYRLRREGDAWFDYVVGPHSLKQFLFPPQETIVEAERTDGNWQFRPAPTSATPLAVVGPRSCDLHALKIQDRVFLGDQYVDPGYQARRENLFVAAVNCRRSAETCFCHSMNTGPAVSVGFDLALTELDDCFLVRIGSSAGAEVIVNADWAPASTTELDEANGLVQRLAADMQQQHRSLETAGLRDLLMNNLDHARWDQVADRCLACANCTMVCPTCFCSSVDEVSDLTGDHVRRERSWSSCFTAEHSYMHSGNVRKTTASRYRQWLTHKLATWQDQFGTSGCTGCGRCITWCPVGIDLTEEVAAIRGKD